MSQTHKKFYNINRWEQRFFMNLTPAQKLAWEYVNDKSDNIGVWEPNLKILQFHIGAEIHVKKLFKAVNDDEDRLLKLNSGCWFIPGYVKFQYCQSNPLNPNNRAHRSYLKDMDSRGLLEWFCIHQPEVMATSLNYEKELNGKQLNNIPKPFKSFLDQLIKRSSRGLKEFSESRIEKDKEKAPEKDTEQEKDPAPEKANKGIQANNDKEASNGQPSTYEIIKKNIGALALTDLGEIPFQKDVDMILDELAESDVKEPIQYLIGQMQKVDWIDTSWQEFRDQILAAEETPF